MYLNKITLIGFIGNDAERKAANSTNIAIFCKRQAIHGVCGNGGTDYRFRAAQAAGVSSASF